MTTKIAKDELFNKLNDIAKEHVDTLETRNCDDYDFPEVAVWALEDMLRKAYLAGIADHDKGITGIKEDKGTFEIRAIVDGCWDTVQHLHGVTETQAAEFVKQEAERRGLPQGCVVAHFKG